MELDAKTLTPHACIGKSSTKSVRLGWGGVTSDFLDEGRV